MADAQWIISTVAGTGEKGYAGDGGPATQALLNNPFDLAFDPAGNLCFSDTYNHCIRRIDARTGVITTIAGTGERGFSGDGGPATQARMDQPYGIVIDRAGNIYVADRLNGRVRRIDGGTGVITTLAGDGSGKYSGDGGPSDRAGTGGAEWPRTGSRASPPVHRRCRRSPGARDRSRLRRHHHIRRHRQRASRRRRRSRHVSRRLRRPCGRAGARRLALPHGAAGQQRAPHPQRHHRDRRRHRRARLRRRWTRCAPRGVRRAEGDGGRSRGQHLHRRYREPCDPADRRAELDRHHHRRQRQTRSRRTRTTARRCRRTGWRRLYRRFREPPRAQAAYRQALACRFPDQRLRCSSSCLAGQAGCWICRLLAACSPRSPRSLRQPASDGRLQDLRRCRQGRAGRRARGVLHRSRGPRGEGTGKVPRGLPQDQTNVSATSGRRPLRQAADRAAGQFLLRRHRPAFRHELRARFPKARRLHAVRVAGDGGVQAGIPKLARGLLDLGRAGDGGDRLQSHPGDTRGSAEDLPGHARSEMGRCDFGEGVDIGSAARRVVCAASALRQRLLAAACAAPAARVRTPMSSSSTAW